MKKKLNKMVTFLEPSSISIKENFNPILVAMEKEVIAIEQTLNDENLSSEDYVQLIRRWTFLQVRLYKSVNQLFPITILGFTKPV